MKARRKTKTRRGKSPTTAKSNFYLHRNNNHTTMLNKLLTLPKQLIRSFKKLPQTQKLVVLAVLALGGWWLWQNYLQPRLEGFGEKNKVGTLTCTMYYTDSCPHCVKAKPEWGQFAQAFNGKTVGDNKVMITSVNCEKFPEIAKQQNIGGFPTFRFEMNGKQLDYQNERTYDAFKRYIESVSFSDFQ